MRQSLLEPIEETIAPLKYQRFQHKIRLGHFGNKEVNWLDRGMHRFIDSPAVVGGTPCPIPKWVDDGKRKQSSPGR